MAASASASNAARSKMLRDPGEMGLPHLLQDELVERGKSGGHGVTSVGDDVSEDSYCSCSLGVAGAPAGRG
jgi:hypothetical protein